MTVTTHQGATLPAGPTPGTNGVRGYRGEESLTDRAMAKVQGFASRVEEEREIEEADGIRETLHQQMDLVGAILTVVIAGAAAYAGINVMSNIAGTMALSDGGPNSSADMFYNASVALENGIGSFFTQLPTVFVVIALVLIISYLTILRR